MTPTPGKNFIFSGIRSLVPYAVSAVIAFLARKYGIVLSETASADVMAVAYGVAFAIYYLAVRLVETYVTPNVSFLLGDFRKGHTEPIYADATETVVVPPATAAPEA